MQAIHAKQRTVSADTQAAQVFFQPLVELTCVSHLFWRLVAT